MDKKYYHRGNGECVCPDITEPADTFPKGLIHAEWDSRINSLPVLAYCDPSHPVGWLPGAVEVYQVRIMDRWADVSVYFYNVTKTEKRIWLEVPEQTADQPHKCQYCGAMTTQPDEQCWNNPKNHKFAEGEDDIANDTFEEKPATDYNKEAEERYPITDDMDFAWKELAANARVVHVTAREMSAKEWEEWQNKLHNDRAHIAVWLRRIKTECLVPELNDFGFVSAKELAELREENERLKSFLEQYVKAMEPHYKTEDKAWQQFKQQNNIS